MKHRLLKAAAAVVFTCAAFHVQAANPFTDVDTNSWAYQAVSKLSAENVVEGYPDGTFRGEKNISRYEVAQIIARLVARKDSLTADQQATVDKLAQSYRDDLANLASASLNLKRRPVTQNSSLNSVFRMSTAMAIFSKVTRKRTMSSAPASA